MAMGRNYGFSLISVCLIAASACAAMAARLGDLMRLYVPDPIQRAVAEFRAALTTFLVLAASYMGPREGVPRLDLPMEVNRQHVSDARVVSYGARRTARFDRQHVDQGWLAAA